MSVSEKVTVVLGGELVEPRHAERAEDRPPWGQLQLAESAASSTGPLGERPLDVLLVCTANMCRSPVAEALLRHHLAGIGSDVVVHSAGTRGGGKRADPTVLKMLRRRGLRVRRLRSTALTREQLSRADLVLAMARENADAIELMAPESCSRLFTLNELIRRSEAVGGPRPDETFESWVARLHAGREVRRIGQWSPGDDIFDPFGRSVAEYENMADELDALTSTLADLLAGARRSVAGSSTISIGGELEVQPDAAGTQGGKGRPYDRARDECDPEDVYDADDEYEVDGDADHENDDGTGEPSMKVEQVTTGNDSFNQARSAAVEESVDGLRMARQALQDAQQMVMGAVQQLTDALGAVPCAHAAMPLDGYTQLGEEVAAVLRDAAATASVVRAEADRYANNTRQEAERDAHALRTQAQSDATEMRRKASEESGTMRRDAREAALALAEATRLRYAELFAADDELRSHLREAAQALVAVLEGPQARPLVDPDNVHRTRNG